MPVNFLDIVTDKKEFGICDDIPGSPARLDFSNNRDTWIALVKNYIKAKITFVPIDHRLELGHQKRCDVLLSYEKASDKTIIFVELKHRNDNAWKKTADEQLRETIRYFENSDESKQYTVKRAHIANNLRPHFNDDDMIRKRKFYTDTKYSLEIKARNTNKLRTRPGSKRSMPCS
jgi:hypothetical protein